MRKALGYSVIWIVLTLWSALPAHAAELLMFESAYCEWCERWDEEIGVVYDKTEEGRAAPLRRVQLRNGLPDGIEFASRPNYTPTFVLVHEGREIARLEGYPGEHFFWPILAQMLERLPSGPQPATN